MKYLIVTLLALFIALPAHAADKDNAYDRVIKSGKIRCGYYVFPPATQVDPNTGELSGMFVEMWEILGKNMNLDVEWTEELSFGNMYEGLMTGRYDAICTPDWPNAASARVALYTVPVFFSGINVYVRGDDTRFDNGFMALNDESYTVSVQDGSVEDQIRQLRFPNAKTTGISRDAPATQMELNVMNKKADATFLDHNRFMQFNEAHPGALKKINDDPIRIYPFKVAVARGEYDLKFWIDESIEELIHNGEMTRLIDKWELFPGSFLPVAKPYEVQK
ncbi:MAG: amino acid ABC transporter substrate-binding protein [Rhodospirillales bacterium]|nr:amino acid ABC transporter substrate-binding protein [Rhodospirillales bacterium]